MIVKKEIMDESGINRTLKRLAYEILEHNKGVDALAIVGIRDRGDSLAQRLHHLIQEIENKEVPIGVLDITLYRDDFRRFSEKAVLQGTEIDFDVTNLKVVLVDDVLYTGRTIRAALDALIDLGRPSQIQLAVLVDRGHREFPIKADYVGKNIPTSSGEEVQVRLKEMDGEDSVVILEV